MRSSVAASFHKLHGGYSLPLVCSTTRRGLTLGVGEQGRFIEVLHSALETHGVSSTIDHGFKTL